jgi:transposase
VFKCDSCGFESDRDLNAAMKLKKEAVRLIVLACGLDSADTARVKHRRKSQLLLALVSFFVSVSSYYLIDVNTE